MRLLAALLFVLPCLAADLPPADKLLEKALFNTGGEAAIAKYKASVMTGTIDMAGGALVGTVSTYQAENRTYSMIELPGIGKVEEGFDGETAWEMSAIQGVRVKDGPERDLAVRSAKMTPLSGWHDEYSAAKTVGEDVVEGRDTWKVEMTPKSGKPEMFFLDKESGLLVRMSATMATAMGDMAVDNLIGDYREVSGIQTPFKMVIKAMNQSMTMKFDKVSYQTAVPEGRFDLPAAVKAIVEKRKAAAPAAK